MMDRRLPLLVLLLAAPACGRDPARDEPAEPPPPEAARAASPATPAAPPPAPGGALLLGAPIDKTAAERLESLEVEGLVAGPSAVRNGAAERLYSIPSENEMRKLAVAFHVEPCTAEPESCPPRIDAAWAGRAVEAVSIPVSMGFAVPAGEMKKIEGRDVLTLRSREQLPGGLSRDALVWITHDGVNLVVISATIQSVPEDAPPTDAEYEDAAGRVLRALLAAR